jgi:hypothetical protein
MMAVVQITGVGIMRLIGISLESHANLADAVIDVARAIRDNYGAGTITNPNKDRDFSDDDYLGGWTSYPNEEWKALFPDEKIYIIDAGKEVDEYEMARFVEAFTVSN